MYGDGEDPATLSHPGLLRSLTSLVNACGECLVLMQHRKNAMESAAARKERQRRNSNGAALATAVRQLDGRSSEGPATSSKAAGSSEGMSGLHTPRPACACAVLTAISAA